MGAWCGPGCADGCRARDLTVGSNVLVLISRFPEVRRWRVRRRASNLYEAGLARLVRRAVVARVGATGVVLASARGRDAPPEELTLPPDFPCTRFTGIVVTVGDPPQERLLLRRWPDDGTWTRDVAFEQWLSHLPQGACEDDPVCDAPATLWVWYDLRSDGPSCERCLARRRLRRKIQQPPNGGSGRHADPVPVATWDTTLDAWDVRPDDIPGHLRAGRGHRQGGCGSR